MWNLKYGTDEPTHGTETESRFVVVKGEEGGRRMDWDLGISGCKLSHPEWISNEVLLTARGTISNYL